MPIIIVFKIATSYNITSYFCNNRKIKMHHISLDDIRLFVAVVQSGSLTSASELTGIPVSRLSRRLTALEQDLGTQLVNRGKKGVSLHELGEDFFQHAQSMLYHAELAIGGVHHGLVEPSGVLKISLPIDMMGLLQDKLSQYLALYPQVQLDINLTQQKINMIQDGIDVAIRAGAIENENVVAKLLKMQHFVLCANSDYLQQHQRLETPHDLYQHRLIVQSLMQGWIFQHKERQIKIVPQAYISCNHFEIVADFIHQGLGIGVLPLELLNKYPDLIPILQDWQLPSVPLSIIYYKNRGAVPTVKSFVEWLLQQFTSY